MTMIAAWATRYPGKSQSGRLLFRADWALTGASGDGVSTMVAAPGSLSVVAFVKASDVAVAVGAINTTTAPE